MEAVSIMPHYSVSELKAEKLENFIEEHVKGVYLAVLDIAPHLPTDASIVAEYPMELGYDPRLGCHVLIESNPPFIGLADVVRRGGNNEADRFVGYCSQEFGGVSVEQDYGCVFGESVAHPPRF